MAKIGEGYAAGWAAAGRTELAQALVALPDSNIRHVGISAEKGGYSQALSNYQRDQGVSAENDRGMQR